MENSSELFVVIGLLSLQENGEVVNGERPAYDRAYSETNSRSQLILSDAISGKSLPAPSTPCDINVDVGLPQVQ